MDDENDPIEAALERGRRQALTDLIKHCVRELGVTDSAAELARLLSERESVVRQLREVCELLGDNEWDDGLHLGDVIEKHLAVHLDWSELQPTGDEEDGDV